MYLCLKFHCTIVWTCICSCVVSGHAYLVGAAIGLHNKVKKKLDCDMIHD